MRKSSSDSKRHGIILHSLHFSWIESRCCQDSHLIPIHVLVTLESMQIKEIVIKAVPGKRFRKKTIDLWLHIWMRTAARGTRGRSSTVPKIAASCTVKPPCRLHQIVGTRTNRSTAIADLAAP